MCVPFIIWSLIYSALTLVKNIHNAAEINWLGFAYGFIVGKSATPFYYIVVLVQLTVITSWLVKIVKETGRISKALWLVTLVYLLYGMSLRVHLHGFMKHCFHRGLDFTPVRLSLARFCIQLL